MKKSVYIVLKSGRDVEVNDFEYISYPDTSDSKKITKVESFENFYLYHRLITFVGKDNIVSLNSNDIEYIKFFGISNK